MKLDMKNLEKTEYRQSYLKYSLREAIADQVRIIRDKNGLTQSELAEKSDTTQSVVSRLENPDSPNVNISSLIKVANALDVALSIEFCGFRKYIRYLDRVRSDAKKVQNFFEEIEGEKQKASNIEKYGVFVNNIKNHTEQNIELRNHPIDLYRRQALVRQYQSRRRRFDLEVDQNDSFSAQIGQGFQQGEL